MEALVNNFINATGWSIFHSLWQGAAIYILLFILFQGFPRISARIKHNLAYASICGIFIAFCITFCSVFQIPVQTSVRPDTLLFINNYTFPTSLSTRAESFFPILVVLYLIGIVLQMGIVTSGYLKLLQLKKAATSAIPENWQQLFNHIKTDLGLKKNIGFFLSEHVNVPLVLGYFKPVVLFPVAFVTQLEMSHVESILIHELSHIRRNDYLLNLVKTAIETILFFNPFVWMCSKLIHIEREHACDDLVVKRTGTPLTYAHALLQLELIKQKHTPALSMAASGNQQHLYQRIKRITDMKTNYMNIKQQIFVIFLTVATIASLAWINPSKASLESSKKVFKKAIHETAFAASSQLSFQRNPLPSDTTKKKKIKIITTDKNGVKKEYNSIQELPDSLRRITSDGALSLNSDSLQLVLSPLTNDVANQIQIMIASPEWKKQMENIQIQSANLVKQFNSEDWKKQQITIQKNAEEMEKRFNSPEWKKQQEKMIKTAQNIQIHFNSPEWKKQQEKMIKTAQNIQIHFNSPEWKKKMEDLNSVYGSPEYKELQSKFNKDVEQLRKKKEEEAAAKN